MIRVKPGFLNTDLTTTLASLLKNKKISSHKTVGFIKFRSSDIKEVKPQKYGTIRLEFTYFGRNTQYVGRSKSEEFRKEHYTAKKTKSLKSRLESNLTYQLQRQREIIQNRIKLSEFSEYDKIKSIRLINANLSHFHCSEPINLRDVLDTGDSPKEKLASVFKPTATTVQKTIKSQPILQRPKHTRETKGKGKDPQHDESLFNQTYLQPISSHNMSFKILGSIIRHEDKQKTLGYKVRMSKLFLSDKLLNKTHNMLEKTVLDAELRPKHKSVDLPTETKIVESVGSTISYSKWKNFSELVYGIVGSQELLRTLLNSHPECPKTKYKKLHARLSERGKLDRIFRRRGRTRCLKWMKHQTLKADDEMMDEKDETEEIFEIYKASNILSTQHNIKEIQIIQEKLLESLGRFVVRQELLCFSNGFSTIRTLVFIRPSLFMEVYF
ncbi:uncharacterized protein LOC106867360 isoform X2 [Octopus bimaculoides]|nr:uncharacterized protein LOC106867360 isoform X2 [Octopus bimaculoides]|eukprot:XP_014767694.1 PREDICTED: uncharacterized protein LOC106867360 isoform X2 [Octopus bimaculoides]